MRDEILITTFTDFPLATAVRATKCCCLRGKQGVDPKKTKNESQVTTKRAEAKHKQNQRTKSVKIQGAKIGNIPRGDTGEGTGGERRVASRGNTEEDGTN